MAERARQPGGNVRATGRWSRRGAVLAACALALALVALVGVINVYSGGTSDIVVTDAWARPAIAATPDAPGTDPGASGAMLGSANSVAYLTIVNRGDGRDKLTGVTAEGASAVEVHQSTIDNNVASMRRVRAVDVPVRGEVRFNPGGYHLVLVKMGRDLRPGDTVELVLTFERAGPVRVIAQVREP